MVLLWEEVNFTLAWMEQCEKLRSWDDWKMIYLLLPTEWQHIDGWLRGCWVPIDGKLIRKSNVKNRLLTEISRNLTKTSLEMCCHEQNMGTIPSRCLPCMRLWTALIKLPGLNYNQSVSSVFFNCPPQGLGNKRYCLTLLLLTWLISSVKLSTVEFYLQHLEPTKFCHWCNAATQC